MLKSRINPSQLQRRKDILTAARWCFLNFGFAKTSFEDIAKRAGLSRTVLYRVFKDKEQIFQEDFAEWLLAREPAAREAAARNGNAYERLLEVCRVLALEPWAEMVNAPMSGDYRETCERIDATNAKRHEEVLHTCTTQILGDSALAEVFVLAFQGLFSDQPQPLVLEARVELLAQRFAPPPARKKKGMR